MEEIFDDSGCNKAMHIDLVLRTLFNFLDSKDLQSCRLVCSTWEQVSRSYFAKRSKLFIAGNANSKALDIFEKTFCNASVFPFTKLCFQGSFPANKFEDVFNKWPTIKELFIESVVLEDPDGTGAHKYVVSNWNPLKLTTLSCINRNNSTNIAIPFSQITSIKKLYLHGCFSLVFDAQICPDELSIQGGVRFFREGKLIQNAIRLNDFIDLKAVRKLTINQPQQTSVTVDVTDCQHLESLSNHWGQLVGLSQHSTIKELSISSGCDLSFLPEDIEKLTLGRDHLSCSAEVNLPRLKYLNTDNGHFLPKFLNCPNLTDLVIGPFHCHQDPVPIPRNVSRIFLNATQTFHFPTNIITELDYLHLELVGNWPRVLLQHNWSIKKALEILKVVQSQTLVITFKATERPLFTKKWGTINTSCQDVLADLVKIIKFQSERGGTVAVGSIEWDADCPSLLTLVDKKSEFYLFTNGQGKGIDQVHFEKLVVLETDRA